MTTDLKPRNWTATVTHSFTDENNVFRASGALHNEKRGIDYPFDMSGPNITARKRTSKNGFGYKAVTLPQEHAVLIALQAEKPAAPAPGTTPEGVAVFEPGTVYATRSVCDHDCIYAYKVISRTAKTVRVCEVEPATGKVTGNPKTRRVSLAYDNRAETFLPHGRYSMCAVIMADKLLEDF